MTISFTIPGRVGGKRRIRHHGKQHFMDVKTRSDQEIVRFFAHCAMKGVEPICGPVAVTMQVYLSPPASWSNKKRQSARYVTGKPDPDNAQKLIFDSMNKIVWLDDSQISDVQFARRYSLTEPEHVRITVTPLSQEKDAA